MDLSFSTLFRILLLLVLAGLSGALGWRILSRRRSLPCPSALIWMLEHRLMENVAGATTIMERAEIRPGMQVLDAGSGAGRIAIPIAQCVGSEGRVVAMDIQASMQERLRERIQAAQVGNIVPLLAPLGAGRLDAETFDRAIMVTVLGEIPDQVAALNEIYQALKPGGILSITEVLPDPHFQSQRTIYTLAKEVGFKAEKVYSNYRSHTINLTRPFNV